MSLSRLLPITCYEAGLGESGALTFELAFETAQFKKHVIKLYRDTYISPLPSSIAGLVGAMLGIRRSHLRDFACEKGLLTGAALLGYEGIVSETMTVVKMKEWGRYIRTPKRSVLLYKPLYKVAVASPDLDLMRDLERRLRKLDFEFEIFGGNDYNFFSNLGSVREGKLVKTREGIGYFRLSDLEGWEGNGTLHIDEVNEEGLVKYAFGQGVVLRLREESMAVDDGQDRVLVHGSWRFLR
ncbi:MAG: CRISPR-associated protein Cas5 [Candidatus Korarchaeum sp.]